MTYPQSRIKVDAIEGAESGAVSISYGATVPSGQQFTVLGNVTLNGIVTATSFDGSGANLTNIDVIGLQKAVAFNLVVG